MVGSWFSVRSCLVPPHQGSGPLCVSGDTEPLGVSHVCLQLATIHAPPSLTALPPSMPTLARSTVGNHEKDKADLRLYISVSIPPTVVRQTYPHQKLHRRRGCALGSKSGAIGVSRSLKQAAGLALHTPRGGQGSLLQPPWPPSTCPKLRHHRLLPPMPVREFQSQHGAETDTAGFAFAVMPRWHAIRSFRHCKADAVLQVLIDSQARLATSCELHQTE